MTTYRELLVGCGHNRDKRIEPYLFAPDLVTFAEIRRAWRGEVETIDCNPNCKPDMVWDLNKTPWCRLGDEGAYPLAESVYDEIHAYEVLEHLGQQGDFHAFFATFSEIWRLLKPGGFLAATCPSRYCEWLWGDPGHTRAILPASLVFLNQQHYTEQLGQTSMSGYGHVYQADFDILLSHDNRTSHQFVLRAVKPSRWVPPSQWTPT